MTRYLSHCVIAFIMAVSAVNEAAATPSTQIWIPSTDIQPFGKVHLGFDQYVKVRGTGPAAREANVINNGITVGVLPYDKVQMEIGFDLRHYGVEPADSDPVYFNAKIGVPEDMLFKGAPAVAVGGFDFGTRSYDALRAYGTDYNIAYALVAKTLGAFGRISAGGYTGSDKLLLDAAGQKDNSGILLSWDKTVSEISDKLWVALDYMGSDNAYGAVSGGVAWKFAPNVGVILGYDRYNNRNFKPTYTLQIDIDTP